MVLFVGYLTIYLLAFIGVLALIGAIKKAFSTYD